MLTPARFLGYLILVGSIGAGCAAAETASSQSSTDPTGDAPDGVAPAAPSRGDGDGETDDAGTDAARDGSASSADGSAAVDAAPQNACAGVDLQTSASNCGVCGHDCKGSSCDEGTCKSQSFAALGDSQMNIHAMGRDNGRIVLVVSTRFQPASPVRILAVDPSAAPGTPVTVIADNLFAGSGEIRARLGEDRAVYIVRSTALAGDPAACGGAATGGDHCERFYRVSLVDGSSEMWASERSNGPLLTSDFLIGNGQRMLRVDDGNIFEYTKSGATGRQRVVQPWGILMEPTFAHVLRADRLERLDYATFQSTDSFSGTGTMASSLLGKVGSKLYVTFRGKTSTRVYAFDANAPASQPLLLTTVTTSSERPFRSGDVDPAHAVFSAGVAVADPRFVSLDLATGILTPMRVDAPFAAYGPWLYSVELVANGSTLKSAVVRTAL